MNVLQENFSTLFGIIISTFEVLAKNAYPFISVRPSSKIIFSRDGSSENAGRLGLKLTFLGIVTVFSDVHSENADFPMVLSDSGNLRSVKAEQP